MQSMFFHVPSNGLRCGGFVLASREAVPVPFPAADFDIWKPFTFGLTWRTNCGACALLGECHDHFALKIVLPRWQNTPATKSAQMGNLAADRPYSRMSPKRPPRSDARFQAGLGLGQPSQIFRGSSWPSRYNSRAWDAFYLLGPFGYRYLHWLCGWIPVVWFRECFDKQYR